MKKTLKLMAMLFGAIAVLVGSSSCSDDDDNECCTLTETYDSVTYTYVACEDGSLTYTVNGVTETDNWTDYFDNWAAIKAMAIEEGASCD